MNTSSQTPAAVAINRLHSEAVRRTDESRACLHAALEAAWHAGCLLHAEKSRVRRTMGAGAWLLWLQQNFEGTPRTAQNYMRLAESEPEVSKLKGMSLRQTYIRLGIATEPKTHANREALKKLPDHVRFAHKLVVALKPCAHMKKVTADQCTAYRQDLRPLYDLLRPLFEMDSANLVFTQNSIRKKQ